MFGQEWADFSDAESGEAVRQDRKSLLFIIHDSKILSCCDWSQRRGVNRDEDVVINGLVAREDQEQLKVPVSTWTCPRDLGHFVRG